MVARFHPYLRAAAGPAPSGSTDELRSHLLARAPHLGSPLGGATAPAGVVQHLNHRAAATWQGPGLALYHRRSPELWLVEDNTARGTRTRFLLTGHGRWDLHSLQELSQYGRYQVTLHSHAGTSEAWKSDLDLYDRLGASDRQMLRLPHLEISGEAPRPAPAHLTTTTTTASPDPAQCADVLAQLKLPYNVRSLNAATHEWAHYASLDLAIDDLPGAAHRECAAFVALELNALAAASRAWRHPWEEARLGGAPTKPSHHSKLVRATVRAVVTDTVINTFCERSLTLLAPGLDHLDAQDFVRTAERCLQFLWDRDARNAVVWFNLDKCFAAVRYSIPLENPTRRAPVDAKPALPTPSQDGCEPPTLPGPGGLHPPGATAE
eukprot:g11319.t1